MKKVIFSICLLVGSLTFAQTKEHKPELKLELRSNAKDEVISRIDNDKKEQHIELKKDQIQDRISHKLERKHERPHFDKIKENKDREKSGDQQRKEKLHDRHEKRQEIIKERRNG
jgi:hypothetical protein